MLRHLAEKPPSGPLNGHRYEPRHGVAALGPFELKLHRDARPDSGKAAASADARGTKLVL